MNLQSYIQSGVVEGYVLGLLTPDEKIEFEYHLSVSPLLQQAVTSAEAQVEQYALSQAVPPPPGARDRFTSFIDKLPVPRKETVKELPLDGGGPGNPNYIPAYEVSSSHIRVHKYWRIAFLVLFILSKIFLAFLIYYIIKFYNARDEVRQLQQHEKVEKARR